MRVGIDAGNPAHGVVVVELLQHRQRQVESFDPRAVIIEGVIGRESSASRANTEPPNFRLPSPYAAFPNQRTNQSRTGCGRGTSKMKART